MTSKKNKIVLPLVIVAAVVIVILVLVFSLLDFGADSGPPSGTWAVEETFEGAVTSDFTVNISNLRAANYFQLFIEDVQIGERVPIDEHVRSVSIIFTRPEAMEVFFFSDYESEEPLTTARCLESGMLIFTETEQPEEDSISDD